MEFGKHTYGKPRLHWSNENAKLVVGNFCSIAASVDIYLGGNHRVDWVTTFPFPALWPSAKNITGHPSTRGDVVIGHDVWIGSKVTIMSGVTIGDGAVIANSSHVVKSVEPYSLIGGNPAKLIKYRFTSEQIEKLLKIKWWFWDDEKIKKFSTLLCSSDIDMFINSAL